MDTGISQARSSYNKLNSAITKFQNSDNKASSELKKFCCTYKLIEMANNVTTKIPFKDESELIINKLDLNYGISAWYISPSDIEGDNWRAMLNTKDLDLIVAQTKK